MSKDRVRAFQPVFSMHPVPSREHQHPRRQITLDHPPPAFRRRHIAARQAPLPQAVVFTTRKRLSGDPGVAMGFVAGDQPVAMIAPVMIRNDVQPHYVTSSHRSSKMRGTRSHDGPACWSARPTR